MNQVQKPAAPETPEPNRQRSAFRWPRFAVFAAVTLIAIAILAACAMALPTGTPAVDEADQAASAETEAAAAEDTETAETDTAETDGTESAGEAAWLSGEEEEYHGVPVGFTEDGYPYRGSLDAPVVIYEYSDYACPFCSRYYVQTEPAINEQYVRDGIVRVVFREFPLEQLHPNAPSAHAASLCVAEQGAANYWEMHGELFNTQAEWSQNPDALTYFEGLVDELGVDLDQYRECMGASEVYEMIDAGINDARAVGFQGTPSFNFVNPETEESFSLVGAQPYEQFAAYIEAIVAGEAPAGAEAQADQGGSDEIPFWATEEGLTPDPDKPGQTKAGDYFRGNPDADVVVVEFSDFQCPFCRRHTEDTQPVLDEQFVDTDQVMWVFKHFPLQIHPQAPMAGAAAECAGEQEKFWEMNHLLFEETNAWAVSDPTDALVELAGQLELDTEAFAACLADEATLARVDADMADGTPYVRGTPTFIMLQGGSGSIIPGALPAESFSEALQGILDQAAAEE